MSENTKLIIGSIVMIILQALLAPVIKINSIVPNFMLAFTIACVVSRPDKNLLVYAFFMGLIYDLTTQGPIGAMSFTMILVSFVVALILSRIQNTNMFIAIISIVASILVAEMIYGIFQIALSIDSSFLDIITYRVLPCCIYDVILSIIFLPLMSRILSVPDNSNFYEINSRR